MEHFGNQTHVVAFWASFTISREWNPFQAVTTKSERNWAGKLKNFISFHFRQWHSGFGLALQKSTKIRGDFLKITSKDFRNIHSNTQKIYLVYLRIVRSDREHVHYLVDHQRLVSTYSPGFANLQELPIRDNHPQTDITTANRTLMEWLIMCAMKLNCATLCLIAGGFVCICMAIAWLRCLCVSGHMSNYINTFDATSR